MIVKILQALFIFWFGAGTMVYAQEHDTTKTIATAALTICATMLFCS